MDKEEKEEDVTEGEGRNCLEEERTKERAMMVLRPAAMTWLGSAGGERY